jgi:hypothetical protein
MTSADLTALASQTAEKLLSLVMSSERRPHGAAPLATREFQQIILEALQIAIAPYEEQLEFWKGSHDPIIRPYLDRIQALEIALAQQEAEIATLKRHGKVDDLAFDSANRGLVEAEARIAELEIALAQFSPDPPQKPWHPGDSERQDDAVRRRLALPASDLGTRLRTLAQDLVALADEVDQQNAAALRQAETCAALESQVARLSTPAGGPAVSSEFP